MAEQNPVEVEEEAKSSEKIMCFISKKMVAIEDTVEVEYQGHRRVRILPQYIKYEEADA